MLKARIQSVTRPRRAQVLKWVMRAASAVLVSAGAVAAAYGAGRPGLLGWTSLPLFIGLLLAGLIAGQFFHFAARKFDQHARDLGAAERFAALRTGTATGPYILYLRPFASTDAIADQRVTAVRVGRSGIIVNTDRLEIETEIEAALRSTAPLLALGQPLEHEGAGRIAVPEDLWQDAIDLLMDQASLIILLPSPRDGTLWEVDHLIARGHLDKTLILDPPNHGSSRPDYDPEAEWRAVQTAFAQRGLALPDDHRDGLVMHFPPGARQPDCFPVRLDAARTLSAIVRRKLAEAGA
ncbi:MAG: hypothetical protein AAF253_06300 [Pseudomonadota bacterium]